MNFKRPFKIDEIDLNNLKFTEIKKNSKKTIIYLKYDNNNELCNLVFQSPSLFNVNKPIFRNDNYELDVPLHGKYEEKTLEFIDFKEIDSKIIKEAKRHPEWFNNFIKDDKIKYQKIIRESLNKEFKNGVIKLN